MRKLLIAAAAVALVAAPAFAAKKTTTAAAPAAAPAGTPAATAAKATRTTKSSASGSGLKACATQWDAMSAADKGKFNTQAKGMKSKKGGSLSGYNVFTAQCMKKK